MNLLPAETFGAGTVIAADRIAAGTIVGVRPEDLVLVPDSEPGIDVEIDLVEELGADGYLYGHISGEGPLQQIVARVDGRNHPAAGHTVRLRPNPEHVHLFEAESGRRLG
jgi:multiple sugar transport system ATP-binding protein